MTNENKFIPITQEDYEKWAEQILKDNEHLFNTEQQKKEFMDFVLYGRCETKISFVDKFQSEQILYNICASKIVEEWKKENTQSDQQEPS